MARIGWSRRALHDLKAIEAYIAQFDASAAVIYGHRLRMAAESLAEFPNRGRPADGGRRELPSVPPYVIRYRVTGDDVTILGVRHGRQTTVRR